MNIIDFVIKLSKVNIYNYNWELLFFTVWHQLLFVFLCPPASIISTFVCSAIYRVLLCTFTYYTLIFCLTLIFHPINLTTLLSESSVRPSNTMRVASCIASSPHNRGMSELQEHQWQPFSSAESTAIATINGKYSHVFDFIASASATNDSLFIRICDK